jgi:hypothetical protein
MLAALYALLLAGGGVTLAVGLWPAAILCILAALVIVGRFELRWLIDRAHGLTPRPIPPATHAKH